MPTDAVILAIESPPPHDLPKIVNILTTTTSPRRNIRALSLEYPSSLAVPEPPSALLQGAAKTLRIFEELKLLVPTLSFTVG